MWPSRDDLEQPEEKDAVTREQCVPRRTIAVSPTSLRKCRRNKNFRNVNSSLNFPLRDRIIVTFALSIIGSINDAGSMPNHIFALDPPYDTFVKYRTNKFLRRAKTIVHVRSLQSYAASPEKLVSEEKQIALLVGIRSTDSSLVIRNLQFDCIYEIINETEYTSAIKTRLNWISFLLLCFLLSTRRKFPRYATNETAEKQRTR